MSLYHETAKILEALGWSVSDVEWVGVVKRIWIESAETEIAGPADWWTWDEFAEAAGCEYFRGYGPVYVRPNLVVVGRDWWLERHEYDGSESWKFKRLPVRADRVKPPTNLCDGYDDWIG